MPVRRWTIPIVSAGCLLALLFACYGGVLLRSRQAMDRAAQKLGYAVYRARKLSGDVPTDEYARLSAEVANTETNGCVGGIDLPLRALRPGGYGE